MRVVSRYMTRDKLKALPTGINPDLATSHPVSRTCPAKPRRSSIPYPASRIPYLATRIPQMTTPAITVEKLGKRYRLGHEVKRAASAREAVKNALVAPFRYLSYRMSKATDEDTLWACRDISFEVNRGEVLGIIGANGAGKSTLLKILSRITDPTEGRALIRGRVNALLEVGVGFHPELTGRENIYLNAALHGLSARETRGKLDEIVDFSGIGRFLDTPVKRYSSGMRVRLGFAVAAHLEPEILIVDEVLAVGDVAFQNKCLGKMQDVTQSGRTVIFVSHNMAAVQNLCTRGILLRNGTVAEAGEIDTVVREYLRAQTPEVDRAPVQAGFATLRLTLTNRDGQEQHTFLMGEEVTFELELTVERPVEKADLGLVLINPQGLRIVTFHTKYQRTDKFSIRRRARLSMTWPEITLNAGVYNVYAALDENEKPVAKWASIGRLEVAGANYYGTGKLPDARTHGVMVARTTWHVDEEGGSADV